MGEKKCPHCNAWSKWNQDINDTCEHCGHQLGGADLHYHEKRLAQEKANRENWIFYIKDTDSGFMKGAKKVGNFFYTIYISIITFIAWLIAVLPG
ncbi:hypothetical protein ADIS_3841 [Lunatimonas lonarensis]|uniref:Uncharacterized protein n=1 Tax=Lunatimonas lonarensis TaxID=1232681 RepID=R7ZNJ2_9BACT|nr:hypothetical protein [Lunatimonas lonarensis]EON75691.1 hypothetical protein ADIS_3841 [Lunatimonas lonarensis]